MGLQLKVPEVKIDQSYFTHLNLFNKLDLDAKYVRELDSTFSDSSLSWQNQ